MRSKRSSATGVVSISVMGSVFIAGVYNLSYLALAVTCATVHFEGVQLPVTNHVPYGGLTHAELFGRLFLGERLVFLCFHEDGEKTLSCGFDCVHHQLMKVGEVDGEEDIWRIRVGQRHLKKVVKA